MMVPVQKVLPVETVMTRRIVQIVDNYARMSFDVGPTLMSWFDNFNKSRHLLKHKYDDRFYRMWKYYLLCSAGTFRSRCQQLWQIVLSKKGVPGGYRPVR